VGCLAAGVLVVVVVLAVDEFACARSELALAAAAATPQPSATATAIFAPTSLMSRNIASVVTDSQHRRSGVVIETAPPPEEQRSDPAWQRFEDLYRSSRGDVYAYVTTLLRDHAAAEDVTALAFERAYRRRRTFDRRRGQERAWLFGIARNAALDELRRRKRLARLAVDPADESLETAAREDEGDIALRRTTVRAALDAMPARERELIALKFHGGLSNEELARVLGVSVSNAGTLLHRAMEKLRKACDETS
jgi:RNA polymerase sigma factor (sigma-70 family)